MKKRAFHAIRVRRASEKFNAVPTKSALRAVFEESPDRHAPNIPL